MKIYGYQNIEVEDPKLRELSEISLCASPSNLREIAIFLQSMADAMEKDDSFAHEHLQDNCENWPINFPDIIVCAQS
jgi:hypothetical protein